MYKTTERERALLVMVEVEREKEHWPKEILAEEFKNLVLSTGIDVEDLVFVKRKTLSPSLYIGKGKVEELASAVKEKNINVVIFNNNLRFTQAANLEDIFGVKTIDRTQLILDIFSRHAHTQEGSLQVELAQLEYLLPRLKGQGIMLSRLGGGIGTRGPGEKKLEVDRRRISEHIIRLKKDLEELRHHRETMRKKREKKKIGICSLVGYTNAGKSTLFNALTESGEKTSSDLFTTLDTVSHVLVLHNNLRIILTDTVGFLYKLPHSLIEAFKATLEELNYADLLIHIIDAASPDITRLMKSVNSILKELNLTSKPTLLVFNKIDDLSQSELDELKNDYPQGIFISALRRENLDFLKEKIYENLFKDNLEAILTFPFSLMEVVDYIHKNCEVLKTNYRESEVVYLVRTSVDKLAYLKNRGVQIKEI
ncbi:MAG: GTPase HflX [Candidatus Omnitrophica bacterium]|nr:GTPase HflX [Candidatus Omnitrophota bacterium]